MPSSPAAGVASFCAETSGPELAGTSESPPCGRGPGAGAAEAAGREGTGSESADPPPPVDQATSPPTTSPPLPPAHPESSAKTSMARRETARIRVLRAASAEFIELGTLEMLGQVVSTAVAFTHSVTDSLSVENETVLPPRRSAAPATSGDYSQPTPSPSRSRWDAYPGSPRRTGAAAASRAAVQFSK